MSRWLGFIVALFAVPALAGPPYVTDNPAPTEYGQFEIYAFHLGTHARDGTDGAAGIDFNYGAAPDLQLTIVAPVAFERPSGAHAVTDLGNIELAAKYRILHQQDVGWDVSVFPRVFLPSGSRDVGERHASFLFPIWIGRDWGKWSTFGGGGCAINRGGDSQDFCMVGWALARQILPNLQLGAEIYRQSADIKGGRPTTGLGAGLRYDADDNFHLLGYFGPGVQNASETNLYSWYSSVLFTF